MNPTDTTSQLDDLDFMDMDDVLEQNDIPIQPSMDLFRDVPITVTLEVASTQVSMGELGKAREGDVLPLDKAVNEPLDVKVNGIIFAKAEVVMVDGHYGLKFLEGLKGGPAELNEEQG